MDERVKFHDVTVELIGNDGNAFAILGAVQNALRKAGVSPHDIAEYKRQAMSGDYDNLLRVTAQTVNVE